MIQKRRMEHIKKENGAGAVPVRRGRRLPASFTIEAALLVPVLLAVLFLLLQSILYLHDTVRAEVWLSEQAVRMRRELENDGQPTGERAAEPLPRLAVLHCRDRVVTKRLTSVSAEASFEIRMLSRFAAAFFSGQPQSGTKRVTEKIMDTPGFLRIAGAVLEEMGE